MFEHAPESPHSGQGGPETAAIVPELTPHANRRPPAPVPTPPLARRVSYDRVWSRVLPRVPRLGPRVHIRQIPINTASLHIQGSNHRVHLYLAIISAAAIARPRLVSSPLAHSRIPRALSRSAHIQRRWSGGASTGDSRQHARRMPRIHTP